MNKPKTRQRNEGFLDFCKHELKLELISIVLISLISIVFYNLVKLNDFCVSLSKFITADKINLLCGLYATLSGIYVAVITIIGCSAIGITPSLLKSGKDKSLIYIMIWGLSLNLISIISCILLPITLKLFGVFMIGLFFLVLITFIKFTILLVHIFLANMDAMAKEIDEDEIYRQQIISYLDKISKQ